MSLAGRHLAHRALISLEGEDLISFLQAIVSNDVRPLDKGQPVFAALLTPQGKILFDFFLVPHGDGIMLDCDAAMRDDLFKRLMMYKLRAKVTIAPNDDHSIWVFSDKPDLDGTIYADPRHGNLGYRGILDASPDLSSWDETDYNTRRIKTAIPELGVDFETSQRFLSDVNYDELNGVSYTKGCYVGQEVTARMKHRGGIRKRTLPLSFNGDAPVKGTKLYTDGKPAGEITSTQGPNALALVRLDALERGEVTTENGDKAETLRPEWVKSDNV